MSLYENKYRVTYEAFSKFSAKISKADDKKELLAITETHLKYLFNYKYFRVLIKDEDSLKSFNIFQNSICPTEFILDVVFEYEEKLLAKNIPLHQNTDGSFLNEYQKQLQICEGKLWGWYFEYQDTELCVSLISDKNQPFIVKDIEILNLLIDSFFTKYQQLKLRNRLHKKNLNLENALRIIKNQKLQISKIADNQKKIIEKRTHALIQSNTELAEICRLNAHNAREPLSRILGLIEIADLYTEKELKTTILKNLKTSAEDLDKALRGIIEKSSQTIEKLSKEDLSL